MRSKTEGGEPSEGTVEARSASLWGHWVADARRGVGPMVTSWEASFARRRKLARRDSVSRPPIDRKSAGATASKLLLLGERSESSARRQASNPVMLTGGCGIITGSTGNVGSACSVLLTSWKPEGDARGHRKDEGDRAGILDEFKNQSRASGM